MSKRIDIKNIKLGDLMTVKSYINFMKEKRGIAITKPAVHYQLKNTDNLDYCEWQENIFVINNNKVNTFTPKGN